MKTSYVLLPFTHGIDMDVLEYAVLIAQGRNASLVPLSLIHVSKGHHGGGARLEHIQQSKDFLEAVKYKAARYDVSIERFEVFTVDVVESIFIHAQKMRCEDILLFVRDGEGILLQTHEIKQLMEQGAFKLSIISLPSRADKRSSWSLPRWFFKWLPGKRHEESKWQGQEAEAQFPLEVGNVN
jgi:hypothetical protein